MKFKYNFKVYAPATIADFAVNNNHYSIALQQLQDEIVVKKSSHPGVVIQSIISNKTKISKELKKNTAAYAAHLVLTHLIKTKNLDASLGIELELRKKIPLAYGLGSSIASACAAAIATNIAFGQQLERKELIPFVHKAVQEITQKDRISSIIACLEGGLILATKKQGIEFYRFPLPRGLQFCIAVPKIKPQQFKSKFDTKNDVLKNINSNDAATLTQALYTNNLALINKSLKNYFAYPRCETLTSLKNTVYQINALYFDFIKQGSAMFAFCKNTVDAENTSVVFKTFYESQKIRHTIYVSSINQEGCMAT
jgi:homoserine kinase